MNVPFPLNTQLPFHGVDNERFRFGGVVYEALEDPDDGYRSYLGSVVVRDGGGIFFPNPVAEVRAVDASGAHIDGYDFVDDAGHVWLTIGTNTEDEYYPAFVFRYTPKQA